ncbi:MAG: 4-hydroxy-3-methylbut-2-enyl diphosphate reductase [Planctomycetia bacterium]|nr:4-hydroxy-3-methylbut-2-enyl diphosphate reductase [Planctomycetia bacterium]
MKVTLAEPRGFCAGVNRAINILNNLVNQTREPIYVYHEIVHNTWIARSFERRGVVFIDSIDMAPDGATLLFSAHGVSPQIREIAAQRNMNTIDATCPLVHRIHLQMHIFVESGKHVILIGKKGHDEVVGVLDEAANNATLISCKEDVESLNFAPDQPLTYLTQTTLTVAEVEEIVAALKTRFPQLQEPGNSGICDATQSRQDAVRRLAPGHDVVLVVGSQNSSNSRRLAEIAQSVGVPAYLVDGVNDIPWGKLTPNSSVLLTAGASAPESVVQMCAQFLRDV